MLTAIAVTPAERAAGGLSPDHLAAALAAMRDDGVVVLEDAVDPAHVAALRARMLDDLPRLRARSDAPYNWNSGNIQQSPPRDPALLFRDVLANDQAVAITAELMPAPRNVMYSGNTALPSVHRQPVHGDTGPLWSGFADHPPFAVVVNLLLQDTDAGNGATELWPGTHRLPCALAAGETVIAPAELEVRRRKRPPLQPTLKSGSLVLRDMRLWHAGMPNRTATPRIMLACIHQAAWRYVGRPLDLPAAARDALAHPRLAQHAAWVETGIDHLALDHAHAYVGS